ncbi:PepSY domain-containing protein [Thalassotalea fusca]
MIRWARKYHKWLMVFVGLQFLFWSISGVYMVSMDIHYIHGESLAKRDSEKLNLASVSHSINALVENYPDATGIVLTQHLGKPVYRFTDGENGKLTVDATTGGQLPAVDEAKARDIAHYYYTEQQNINEIRLISQVSDMPAELSPRHLPVWRVTFDNMATPTFYINQQTGAIVAKRHDYWRLFDWMWRFHIMDYDDGENVANWFLMVVAILGLLAALAGAVLTYHRIFLANKRGAVLCRPSN